MSIILYYNATVLLDGLYSQKTQMNDFEKSKEFVFKSMDTVQQNIIVC